MSKKEKTAISPTREEDYPEWYQQVVVQADLAEVAPVRGCMVIKPWGYAIWENLQRQLDDRLKETGHVNAYFPLLIPKSFLEKEAAHVEGFAKECAVVTHHRLEAAPGGGLRPAGELEEPLIIRPTSETIIGEVYRGWVKSYRDLPILVNQWANVVRWERRTRMFLRTTEFLWQEGHTCHATAQEAQEETSRILDLYADFARECLAVPTIKGEKTAGERFPGAVATYAIEAMMQDRKALQAGTSHFLGQNFSKASNIQFLDKDGAQQHVWTTSWGVSTRLIGAVIMQHSDDDGLVVPPRIAPKHIVILPIWRSDADKAAVLEYCDGLHRELRAQTFGGAPMRVQIDLREVHGGRHWEFVKKGVPVLIEVGPGELAKNTVCVRRRDRGSREKTFVPRAEFVAQAGALLQEIQDGLYARALEQRKTHSRTVDSLAEFRQFFTPKNVEKPEIHGGFALAYVSDSPAAQGVLDELKVTARCIPQGDDPAPGTCIVTGQPVLRRVVYAKAY